MCSLPCQGCVPGVSRPLRADCYWCLPQEMVGAVELPVWPAHVVPSLSRLAGVGRVVLRSLLLLSQRREVAPVAG